jgi:hypothetical protein
MKPATNGFPVLLQQFFQRVGCINSVSCCGSFVFLDDAAEQVASSNRRG